MRLPPEVRLIILRCLLKSKGPILSFDKWHDLAGNIKNARSKYKRDLRRSAQVLRTCQTLWVEGYDILYRENTLSLWCEQMGFQFEVNVLKWTAEGLPCWMADLTSSSIDLVDCLLGTCFWGNKPLIKKHVPLVKRFEAYHIDVYLHHDEQNGQEALFVLCRMLQPLLAGKDVTINITNDTDPEDPSEPHRLDLRELSGCKVLRCRSLLFKDYDNTDPVLIDVLRQTSEIDTYDLWLDFTRHFLPHPPDIKAFEAVHKSQLEQLKEHTFEYDTERFIDLRTQIMKLAAAWYDTWAEKKSSPLLKQVDEILQTKTRANQLIAAQLSSKATKPTLEEVKR